MNRNEAVLVMQDILYNFNGKWIDLFAIHESATCGKIGYKLHIKGTINDLSIQKIRKILDEHNLCLKEDNGLVIYEPSAAC